MQIDISRHIGAVVRELTRIEKNGEPAWKLVATRSYATDPDDLWDALTNPERIPRWFLPVTGDLRLGGNYQLQGNASGQILVCHPPQHLGLTWGMHGQTSWVDVYLDKQGRGTELRLEHIAHVPDEFWKQFGPGAVGVGWDGALLGLALHAETGESISPEASQEWQASDEGKRFFRLSSDGWCEASIAAGTDPDEARTAAANTTGFYTGTPPEGAA